MPFLRDSKWIFDTSNGGGASSGILGVEGGTITLLEPVTKGKVRFAYGALGAGFTVGFKIPKLGRLDGYSGSSESMPSYGRVTMNGDFPRDELTVADINGVCCFAEANTGIAWGHSGYVLQFGIHRASFGAGLGSSMLMPIALNTANGCLMFHGWNFGMQAGFGGTGYAGYLHAIDD